MTVTSKENPPEAHEITVDDGIGPMRFVGETVADLSWTYGEAEERGFRRWTDMTLYRVRQEGVAYRYVVQVVGRSVLYHNPIGPCHQGVGVSVGLLAQDEARYQALEACPRPGCQPKDLDELDLAAVVSVEENLYTLHRCATAEDVVKTLHQRNDVAMRKSGGHGSLSIKLLSSACHVDEDIRAAMVQVRKL